MQDFINNLDWMMLLRAFIIGGAICIIGQILIDKTKLTPARILVTFVTIGAILGGLRYISKISWLRRCRSNSSINRVREFACKGSNKKSWNRWHNRCIYWPVQQQLLAALQRQYSLDILLLLLQNLKWKSNKKISSAKQSLFFIFQYVYK